MSGLLFQRQTIEQRLTATSGVTSGWNYLRISLAATVVFFHSLLTCYGVYGTDYVWHSYYRSPLAFVLPAFFALGGFLVSESLGRVKSMTEFVVHRVARIMPALIVEVLLSAIVLGPLQTILPVGLYFSRPAFWTYFFNIVGWVHFYLPGVFWDNPLPGIVNGSLWTIPYEYVGYCTLPIVVLLGIARRRFLFLSLVLIANAAMGGYYAATYVDTHAEHLPGIMMILSFYAGICMRQWKDQIVLSKEWLAGSVVLSVVLLSFPQTEYFAVFPIAYATTFLGLTSPRKIWIVSSGDYSYGLYLFAFPVQQTYAALFPDFRVWWANVIFTLVFGMLCAGFSWHCVEKQVQKRRSRIVAAIENGLRLSGLKPKIATVAAAGN